MAVLPNEPRGKVLPARRGVDPGKPADMDEAEISQRVGGSETNLHVIYVAEEDGVDRFKPTEIEALMLLRGTCNVEAIWPFSREHGGARVQHFMAEEEVPRRRCCPSFRPKGPLLSLCRIFPGSPLPL
jgi:hypothetical protein